MRSTNRTDSTVTLEWHSGGLPSTTAYELQWRQRGRSASDWVTSPTLVVGKSCRKKNLAPCTCYEFRVRAASAWGWSGHCDPVMVVTLPSAGGGGKENGGGAPEGENASASPPRILVSGFQSDGIGGSSTATEKAKAQARTTPKTSKFPQPAQVEEARRRRSQSQAKHSVQFRSSSIAGNDGAEGAEASRAGCREKIGPSSTPPQGMEKTNSWYWRRMSRAAAQDGKEGSNAEGGGGKEKAQRRRTMHEQGSPSEGAWACVVCKRQNEPTSNSCWVCYTARSYQPVNLDRIRTDNDTGGCSGSPLGSARRSSIGSRSRSRSTTPTERDPPKATNVLRMYHVCTSTAGIGVSEKVPSIRVYSIPSPRSKDPGSEGYAADGDGIRVRHASTQSAASTAQPAATSTVGAEGVKDPADVWEFTEGDLDNIGRGVTSHVSDDEWSYASGAGGLDTRSDPGDANRYRRRSSTGGATKRRDRRRFQKGMATAAGDGDSDDDGDAPHKRYLNGRITKLHNVRAEPIRDAKVVGYLIATKEASRVLAEVGDWFKVRWHKRAKDKPKEDECSSSSSSPSSKEDKAPAAAACGTAGDRDGDCKDDDGKKAGESDGVEEASDDGAEKGTGWCVTRDKKHKFIVTIGAEEARSDANRRPSSAKSNRNKSSTGRRRSSVTTDRHSVGLDGSSSAAAAATSGGSGGDDRGVFGEDSEEGECWNELKDEDGSVYYFNATSGISQWEPPLWLDEIDPTTGAVYYVNSYTGDPQWERPEDFVPIVRENPYATTPEQDFIKSVLSPRRSKGPKSFNEAMYRVARGGSAQHLNTVTEGAAGGGRGQPKDAAAA
ncbi:unnamed protein product [Pylaiella littoralis]